MQLMCKDCGQEMTPMKLHVVAYFSKYMQGKQRQRSKDKRKVKPTVYGEVLTTDEVMERLEEEEREKKEKLEEKVRQAGEKAKERAQKAEAKAKNAAEKAAERAKKTERKAQQAAEKAAEKAKKATLSAAGKAKKVTVKMIAKTTNEPQSEEIGMYTNSGTPELRMHVLVHTFVPYRGYPLTAFESVLMQ